MTLADVLVESREYVAPGPLLILWVLLVVCVLAAGAVTALKGRWGWLLAGLLLVGIVWLYSAFLPSRPGSVWARRRGAPSAG